MEALWPIFSLLPIIFLLLPSVWLTPTHSPIEILVATISHQLARLWKPDDWEQVGHRARAFAAFLAIGDVYYARIGESILNRQDERQRNERDALYTPRPATREDASDTIFVIGFLIVLLGLVLGVSYALLLLLQNRPDALVYLFAIAILWFLTTRLAGIFFARFDAVLLPAIGHLHPWHVPSPRNWAEVQDLRRSLAAAMQGEKGALGTMEPQDDPNIVAAQGSPLPLPPGLSEIVFSQHEEAIVAMRDHLGFARRLHVRRRGNGLCDIYCLGGGNAIRCTRH